MLKDTIVKKNQVAHVFNEKKILYCINFEFLVYLEYASKDNDSLILILPFINGGELFSYHRKYFKK